MNPCALAGYQVGYEQRTFWRSRAGAFFTFAFPLLLLMIFGSLNRSAHITTLGPGRLTFTGYFVPSMLSFGVMVACFVNVGTVLSVRRQTGLLKRVRGTPLRPWVFLAGVIGNALVVAVLLGASVTLAGTMFLDVSLPRHWIATGLCLAVGAAAFCAMGVAATALTVDSTAETAGAVLNGVFMPVAFISGTFFPVSNASVLSKVATILPVRHFITAMFATFDPRLHGQGVRAPDLLIVAAWGLVGAIVASRRFRWDPVRK